MPDSRPLNFTVIGAGAWGTAVAAHLARRGQHATLVARRSEHAVAMQLARENRDYLPGMKLPEALTVTSDLRAALLEADVALIASPSHALREWCDRMQSELGGAGRLQLFISLVKGLELGTLLRPSEVMAQALAAANPRNALLELGSIAYPERIRTLRAAVQAALPLLSAKRWSRAAQDFI